MNILQFTLFDLLSGGDPANHPSIIDCPIQQGIPLFVDLAYTILIWLAVIAFIVGIVISVFYYLTAYGDENKAKKGKETLKWTFIGAIVILFSAVAIFAVSNLLLAEPVNVEGIKINKFSQCEQSGSATGQPEEPSEVPGETVSGDE